MDKDRTIYKHFAKTVNDYDTVADKVVIENSELHKQLVNAVPFESSKELKILDLGCGTGHGIGSILEKYPKANITGIDFSGLMIEKAKKNLIKFTDQVELLQANFNEIELGKDFDVVVSAVAIHNSTDKEKEKLFKKISAALVKGGVFINADFIKGESESDDLNYKARYKEYLEENLDGEELSVWLHHAFTEDMPMKLSRQKELLEANSLQGFKVLWQVNNEALYRVVK